ncbi:MAG: hypothetical protein GQ525_13975 [Draconibacterium sp.]|nr:hypothetical protein [Draconibacterium sp.]
MTDNSYTKRHANPLKTGKAKQVIEEICDTVSQWKNFANNVSVDTKLSDEIDKTLIKFV